MLVPTNNLMVPLCKNDFVVFICCGMGSGLGVLGIGRWMYYDTVKLFNFKKTLGFFSQNANNMFLILQIWKCDLLSMPWSEFMKRLKIMVIMSTLQQIFLHWNDPLVFLLYILILPILFYIYMYSYSIVHT